MSTPEEITDACRAILAEPETWEGDDLENLVVLTAKYGFEVTKAFIEWNGKHWSSDSFNMMLIGSFEGWNDVFLDHVLEGQSTVNGVDLWEVLDNASIAKKLTDGELDDYEYLGVATGFCQGIFFKRMAR